MSEEIRTNIKGYHSNDKERCLKFLNDKNYLITSIDTYWLGFGMYFWDNSNNAEYWFGEKSRKNPKKDYAIVKANIFTDEEKLLDLADPETEKMLKFLWNEYCKKKKDEKREQPLGIKIDKLFKFFDILKDNIKVVKGIGEYDPMNKKEEIFINKNIEYHGPKIRGNLKTIYCIREADVVVNRKEYRGFEK